MHGGRQAPQLVALVARTLFVLTITPIQTLFNDICISTNRLHADDRFLPSDNTKTSVHRLHLRPIDRSFVHKITAFFQSYPSLVRIAR